MARTRWGTVVTHLPFKGASLGDIGERPRTKKGLAVGPKGAGGTFRDTGCELAPRCLECPLPMCKYDDPRHTDSRA
jgi:hypothetical protein